MNKLRRMAGVLIFAVAMLCLAAVDVQAVSVQDQDVQWKEGADSYLYTGRAITPGLTVESEYGTLVENKDYTVTYRNNINPGKATATGADDQSHGGRTYTYLPSRRIGYRSHILCLPLLR